MNLETKTMDIQEKRQIDLEHLKLMIDVQRHMAVLSFAGLILAANLSIKLFEDPQYKILALVSMLSFFVCVVSSILSQFNHVDASKKEMIYSYPLTNKFAAPIALSILGLLLGVITLATFVLLNWL